jgi:hypothetical protein
VLGFWWLGGLAAGVDAFHQGGEHRADGTEVFRELAVGLREKVFQIARQVKLVAQFASKAGSDFEKVVELRGAAPPPSAMFEGAEALHRRIWLDSPQRSLFGKRFVWRHTANVSACAVPQTSRLR